MTEIVGNSTSHDRSDENEILFRLLDRPNAVNEAHERAYEIEKEINQRMQSGIAYEQFAKDEIERLNETCDHINSPIIINGGAWLRGIDTSEISDMGGFEATRIYTRDLDDQIATSLLYRAYPDPDDPESRFVVRHFAIEQPQPVAPGPFGAITQAKLIEIPVDRRADVRRLDEILPPHIELLHQYIPDLIDDVDIALDREGSLNNKLLGLHQIDLAEHDILFSEARDTIMGELLYYINDRLKEDIEPPHLVTGTDILMVMPYAGKTVVAESLEISARLNDIRYLPIFDEPRLALSTTSYIEGQGWREIIYPLDENLGVIPETIAFNVQQ